MKEKQSKKIQKTKAAQTPMSIIENQRAIINKLKRDAELEVAEIISNFMNNTGIEKIHEVLIEFEDSNDYDKDDLVGKNDIIIEFIIDVEGPLEYGKRKRYNEEEEDD